MLKSLKVINFRSIEKMDLIFDKNTINFHGENGVGKTNLLHSILFLFGNNIFFGKNDFLIKENSDFLYLEGIFENNGIENKVSINIDNNFKKNILLNQKKVTKKVLEENILKTTFFSPIDMNLFYLGPKYRREFLDNILKNCFLEYQDLLKKYEIILKSRNKLLKNINLGLSKIDEINFWDNNFILLSEKIYKYRIDLINFLKENISENKIFFQNNNVEVSFDYISKTNLGDILGSIKQYLDKNLQRDILIGKTQIGPHIDDFDILINGQKIINFASRGETKSIIMNLKIFEMDYIKLKTLKNPILLIDDLSSELDEKHINSFMKKTNKYQTFLTSILPLNIEELEKINIIKK